MMEIRDMIFVKRLERRLKRNLTDEELDSKDAFEVRFLDGHTEWIAIPTLIFPDELLVRPEDLCVPENIPGHYNNQSAA